MQPTRPNPVRLRMAMLGFLLSYTFALLLPVLMPSQFALICSGHSAKIVKVSGDTADDEAARAAGMDCPLCGCALAPERPAVGTASVGPSGYFSSALYQARLASRSAPALPARGPPALAA